MISGPGKGITVRDTSWHLAILAVSVLPLDTEQESRMGNSGSAELLLLGYFIARI